MPYPLRAFEDGVVFLGPDDDCLAAAYALEEYNYNEDFCVGKEFNPDFIARLMATGFLVMSMELDDEKPQDEKFIILFPRHHLIRSCLFFPELHVKKNICRKLPLYELRFDTDFDTVLDKCICVHGKAWLTDPLVDSIREIKRRHELPVKPVSFSLYRGERLVAGEFGIIAGNVYTSYSGYKEEDNAGTVQMIKTAHYLKDNGFLFWDLGMPLPYKLDLGAREISRKEFLEFFFQGIGKTGTMV